jgi:uncharacterized protein (DUF2141 family)
MILVFFFLFTFSITEFVSAQMPNAKLLEKGSLTIKITGFESDEGECWFGLDNTEEVFEGEDTVFIGKILPVVNREVNLTIEDLPYGNYAIRVFQDENSNSELDTNFLGIPTENYGYSNNASDWFGPPNWDDAKFTFNQKEMFIELLVD